MAERSSRSFVWVSPNSRTIGLAAVLAAMWYAGASQSNGAAYLLGFLLAAVAAISWVHTWANLRGIGLKLESIPPVFVGEELVIPAIMTGKRLRPHFGLRATVKHSQQTTDFQEVGTEGTRGKLRMIGQKRGHYHQFTVVISSTYPLGFFTASTKKIVATSYFIYPVLAGSMPLPRSLAPTREPTSGTRIEGEDFGGTRTWRTGESQRHIDWKAAARGQPLMTKEWTGDASLVLRLDWQALAPQPTEARLSQLAQWIVTAERAGESYSLHLPAESIPANRGDAHFHRCLRALASFDETQSSLSPVT